MCILLSVLVPMWRIICISRRYVIEGTEVTWFVYCLYIIRSLKMQNKGTNSNLQLERRLFRPTIFLVLRHVQFVQF